jgi:hypothetical protein
LTTTHRHPDQNGLLVRHRWLELLHVGIGNWGIVLRGRRIRKMEKMFFFAVILTQLKHKIGEYIALLKPVTVDETPIHISLQ